MSSCNCWAVDDGRLWDGVIGAGGIGLRGRVMVYLFTLIGLCAGSLPLAFWLGRALLGQDVRRIADGNPGAANVWRAGGWRPGLLAAVLDIGKAAVPVALAHYTFGVEGWGLVPVGMAPVIGHAFSPFLGFKGGKAIAVTFGAWGGVAGLEAVIVIALCMGVAYALQTEDAWTVALGLTGWLAYLLFRHPELSLAAFWAGDMMVLVWKHRRELARVPRLRYFGPVRRNS
jgi:glycerol-3-phosphate acyltransferase PlsY